ncbi:MAG TPA: hypothetical protein VFO16_07280 [Pseudonocardiaceae bacterium]|nr:hypothetical protein [Pseudonocardiaceae bacterium]
MTTPDPELLGKIAAEAEHAETTRDLDLPYRPAERIEQLRRIAQARGVEPSVRARQWVHTPDRHAGHGLDPPAGAPSATSQMHAFGHGAKPG